MTHRFNVFSSPRADISALKRKDDIRAAALAVLRTERVGRACRISVFMVDDEEIKEVNLARRKVGRVTDVLSFPSAERKPGKPLLAAVEDIDPDTGRLMLGEVLLCYPQAERQAASYGHSLKREITFLTVHSVLHLLGYDHTEERGGAKMRGREKVIMERLGIPR